MFKPGQLVERVPPRYSYLTFFYCFRENWAYVSDNYPIPENTTESEKQVSCDLLVNLANILCSSY